MTFAKILAPVTGRLEDGRVLATAFAAAQPFHAHVMALFVHPDPREVVSYVYSGAPVSPTIVQSIIDGQTKLAEEARESARSALTATAKDAYATLVHTPAKSSSVTCSFVSHYGYIPRIVSEAARFSDLVVFEPMEKGERPELAALLETLTHAGRPVLLTGTEHHAALGRNVAIGWDGRDAACRAATAALPFLGNASRVEILTVQGDRGRTVTGAGALKNYLSFHGIEAEIRNLTQNDDSIADTLLKGAAKSGADLLVMGGFGHSHLREAILGGVTVEVISSHTLPLFLMH